jgi:phage antirepressor YoqD-like protein
MNQIAKTFNSQQSTMSSKELYEIICIARVENGETQPRINDFHARVRDELDGDYYETFVVQNANKTESTYFRLSIDQCTLVGMRESKAVRRSVLEKLKSLDQPTFFIPQDLPSALRLAADLADKVKEQQNLIESQKPAVEFVERFVETKSSRSLREAAKLLDIKERDFIKRLMDEHILFRQSGNILPYANYQHKGYFTIKTGETNGYAYQQTRFTPEGINWITKRFGLIRGAA